MAPLERTAIVLFWTVGRMTPATVEVVAVLMAASAAVAPRTTGADMLASLQSGL